MTLLSKTSVSGRTLSLLEFIPGVWLFCVPRGGRGRARYTQVGARRLLAARPRERRPTTRLKINRITFRYCDQTEPPTWPNEIQLPTALFTKPPDCLLPAGMVFRDHSPIHGLRGIFPVPQELYQSKPGTVLLLAW